MKGFTAKVKAFLTAHNLLATGDAVLVAVSGGPDSVALLRLLYNLRDELGLRLEVAHLQHGIRGEEARQDAQFVRELANAMGLRFHLEEIDLPRMRSAAGKGNLEALARDRRYRFFGELARRRDIAKVAVAHTQDDQAETVLMWLLRGCGMRGLGGMAPIQRLNDDHDLVVVRPLLGVSKSEILEYLKRENLTYRLDRTNKDAHLLRNWIRLDLIPQLTDRIDPGLPARFAQMAELLRDEHHVLNHLASAELDKIRVPQGLDRRRFLEQEEAVQRLILRRWIEEQRGHLRGIDFDHIQESLRLIKLNKPQSRFSIPGGFELVREYETIRLERALRNSKPLCYSYECYPEVDLKIPEAGLVIRSTRMAPPLAEWPDSLMGAVFDAAHLPAKLAVRNFRQGDIFQPLGIAGHKKLKDLFIDNKVPLSVRSTLPLLCTGREVLWIPGHGRSQSAKVVPQTKEILRFTAAPFEGK
jgi:tRNA(Ile)-lysidine synthase